MTRAKKIAMPARIEPQLCQLVTEPPVGDGWVHEIKLDGYRVLARLDRGRVTLLTRNGQDWTARFPGVARAVAALPARQAWLDGEIVVLDARGISTFQALQEALSGERAADFDYFVFDLLYLDGWDLRGLPLLERKAKLRALVSGDSVMHYLDHTGEKGAAVFARSCKRGLEGLVSKRGDGSYRAGRGHGWLKLRCGQRQEFVIGGFTDSDKGLDFGALLLGAHERSGRLAYAGRVGTGFSRKERKALRAKLQAIEQPDPSFERFPAQAVISGVHWVKPALVAEVGFTSRTRDGLLRHPTFLGLREDKPARQVVVETPGRTKAARRSA
jgi:bifunctional non-homologous end joining protein LigD